MTDHLKLPIQWRESERARKRRAADTSLPRAGFRAGAYCTLLTAAFLAFMAAFWEPPDLELVAGLAAMLLLATFGPALGTILTVRLEFEVTPDGLVRTSGSGVRSSPWKDVGGYRVDESIDPPQLLVQFEGPVGGRKLFGLRAFPLPEDPDLRACIVAHFASHAPLDAALDAPPAAELTRAVVGSYLQFTALLAASGLYGLGIVAPLLLDAMPWGIGWRAWSILCWGGMMLLGPGTVLAIARGFASEPRKALALNGLSVLLSMFWAPLWTFLYLELVGLP